MSPRLQAISDRLAKATPDWRMSTSGAPAVATHDAVIANFYGESGQAHANAQLAAHAPSDLAWCVARIEWLESLLRGAIPHIADALIANRDNSNA